MAHKVRRRPRNGTQRKELFQRFEVNSISSQVVLVVAGLVIGVCIAMIVNNYMPSSLFIDYTNRRL